MVMGFVGFGCGGLWPVVGVVVMGFVVFFFPVVVMVMAGSGLQVVVVVSLSLSLVVVVGLLSVVGVVVMGFLAHCGCCCDEFCGQLWVWW